MPIQSFSFPLPETRFFRAGRHVYKFKIRSGGRYSDEIINSENVTQELEDAVRVVLANLDNLQPFVTKHFNIFPYKSRWERVSELQFQQGGLMLTAYPFLLTLYVETHGALHAHTEIQSLMPVSAAGRSSIYLPNCLPCPHKRSRTEQPQGGSPTQHRCGREPEPPERADGAEGMAGDSGMSLAPTQTPAVSIRNAPRKHHLANAANNQHPTQESTQVPVRLGALHTSSVSSAVLQREGWEEGGAQSEWEELARTEQQGEQGAPAPSERGQPGFLANLASKLFPFYLFFGTACEVACAILTCQSSSTPAYTWTDSFQHPQATILMSPRRPLTPGLFLLLLPLFLLVQLAPFSWSYDGLAFNVTIRSDRKGTCRGMYTVYACVGYCESSAFPSRYSVLVASNFTHNITSASRCCTISRTTKVKVRLDCPLGHHRDDIEILSARACRCDMCRRSRY
ncbi:hypothetical protein GJAV_G00200640 [Gymnothorax javanicus]|nr:hypothetical protein GJAV_G00200640 [Gymnothorax javanicus]